MLLNPCCTHSHPHSHPHSPSLLLHPPGGGDPWIAPSEAGSLVDMMAERGVEVHVDVYEAILAEMDSEGAV